MVYLEIEKNCFLNDSILVLTWFCGNVISYDSSLAFHPSHPSTVRSSSMSPRRPEVLVEPLAGGVDCGEVSQELNCASDVEEKQKNKAKRCQRVLGLGEKPWERPRHDFVL